MRPPVPGILLLYLLSLAACMTGAQVDEVIRSDQARGSVYLERIPDPQFQAAHPIKLDIALIGRILRGALVREQQDVLHALVVGPSGTTPVFSEDDVTFLAPLIAEALTRAAPDQQIGFRIVQAGAPLYSERTGAGVGSSEPPLALSPREETTGALYAYGRSVYLTLSDYRRRPERPDTVGLPNRHLPQTGLANRDLVFVPESAARPDLAPPDFSRDGFGKTLVIDLARLAQAPAGGPSAKPTPPPSHTVPAPTGTAEAAERSPAAPSPELEGIKADMKRKDRELDDLRKELEAIRHQLERQRTDNPPAKDRSRIP